MERDDLGSRVRKFAVNSIGVGVIAGLMVVTAYAKNPASEESVDQTNSRTTNFSFELGKIVGKIELTCTPSSKAYDPDQCLNYIAEFTSRSDAYFDQSDAFFNQVAAEIKKPTYFPPSYNPNCSNCHNSN